MPSANNSGVPKKANSTHFNHMQWVGTKTGSEQHRREVALQTSLPVTALSRKGGKRVRLSRYGR